MANKDSKNNIEDERIEDTTLYGEFISSFDQWITPDRQRQIARYLEEATGEIAPRAEHKNRKKYSR